MNVPLIRHWGGSLIADLYDIFYPPRRGGVWLFWGWWLIIPLIYIVVKVVIYGAIVALIFILMGITALYDIVSYPWRKRRAVPDWAKTPLA